MNYCSTQLVFRVRATSEAMAYNKVFGLCVAVIRRTQLNNMEKMPAHWARPNHIPFRQNHIRDMMGRYVVTYPVPAEEGEMMPYKVEMDGKFTKGDPGWSSTEEALADVARVFEIVTVPDVQLTSVQESIVHWGG